MVFNLLELVLREDALQDAGLMRGRDVVYIKMHNVKSDAFKQDTMYNGIL